MKNKCKASNKSFSIENNKKRNKSKNNFNISSNSSITDCSSFLTPFPLKRNPESRKDAFEYETASRTASILRRMEYSNYILRERKEKEKEKNYDNSCVKSYYYNDKTLVKSETLIQFNIFKILDFEFFRKIAEFVKCICFHLTVS